LPVAELTDQLHALADPTRRTIFDLVVRTPSSVRVLSDQLPVSQPAVSQHLRTLREAALVRRSVVGTRHIYSVDPDGLGNVRLWVESMWDLVLDSFAAAAKTEASQEVES
jgi:DNA-binding transcriptional ArsR family regulator